MKCSICKKEIEKTILDKIVGIYVKVEGKTYPICRNCQKKFNNNKEILENEIKRNL